MKKPKLIFLICLIVSSGIMIGVSLKKMIDKNNEDIVSNKEVIDKFISKQSNLNPAHSTVFSPTETVKNKKISKLSDFLPVDSLGNFDKTLFAISKLSNSLDRIDRDKIWHYLNTEISVDMSDGIRAAEANIRNDLMSVLLRQDPYPFEATEELIALSYNDLGDEVIEGYVIQHLATAVEREPSAVYREKIIDQLWNILEKSSVDAGGTAMIALVRLNSEQNVDKNSKIAITARRWLTQPDIPDRNIVAALNALAIYGTTEDFNKIKYLKNSTDNTVVRLAANYTLSKLDALPAERGKFQ